MALIKCRECGSEISSLAPACPKCGCPTQPSFTSQVPPPIPKQKDKPSTVKGCLGCLGLLVVLFVIGGIYMHGQEKEFTENREQILKQVKAAADAGDQARVVELGDKYEFVHDPELNKYLSAAHATLKAAQDKKRAVEAAAEEKKRATEAAAEEKQRAAQAKADAIAEARRQPDPKRSQIYQDAWRVGYADGEKARRAGEHPMGQAIQMEALNAAQTMYPSGPIDQMEFASGYTDGYGRGYQQ